MVDAFSYSHTTMEGTSLFVFAHENSNSTAFDTIVVYDFPGPTPSFANPKDVRRWNQQSINAAIGSGFDRYWSFRHGQFVGDKVLAQYTLVEENIKTVVLAQTMNVTGVAGKEMDANPADRETPLPSSVVYLREVVYVPNGEGGQVRTVPQGIDDVPTATATTDSNGNYAFSSVPAGEYEVHVPREHFILLHDVSNGGHTVLGDRIDSDLTFANRAAPTLSPDQSVAAWRELGYKIRIVLVP